MGPIALTALGIPEWVLIITGSGHLLSIISFLFALILLGRLMGEHRHPGSTMAWLMGILFVPYITIPLFLLFGGRKLRTLAGRKRGLHLHGQTPGEGPGQQEDPRPTADGNRVELLPDGVETYRRFMEIIEQARESIHVMTFILWRDDVGRQVVESLARRAAEGVEVRLLLDALGGLGAKGRFTDPIRKAGGEVAIFMPMLPIHRRWSANLRNHRKLLIADERIAMVGGRNIGSEYMGPYLKDDRWMDYSMVVEGPSVFSLTEVFAADWEFATGKNIDDRLRIKTIEGIPKAGDVRLQTIASGPDVPDDPLYETLMTSFMQARKRIWVVTPYFVPDETLLRILMSQARLGRDVRLLIPEKSNRMLVDLASRYAQRELARAGAQVYLYQGGMMHTKLVVVDDEMAMAGSPNLDMRSLYLNFEIATVVHDVDHVQEMAWHVDDLMRKARLYRRTPHGTQGLVIESLENVSRLLSPLL